MKKLLLFFMSLYSFIAFGQLSENFEGTTFPPTGWAVFDNGVGPVVSWARTTNTTLTRNGSVGAAYLNREAVAAGQTASDWLVTPQVAVPASGQLQLRFFTRQTLATNEGSIYSIRVSTASQNNIADFTSVPQTWTELTLNTTFNVYEQKIVNLNAFAGQNIYIAFVMENNNGDRWLIDDVKIDQPCTINTNLNAVPNATSATLSWTSQSATGPWEIEYGPVGFTQGTGTIVSAPTNPFVLTGLQAITEYSYYVRTVCDPDLSGPWSATPRDFTTTALPPVCGGSFVDSGSVGGNYGNNENTTTLICPTNPGDLVTVTFTSFNLENNWDFLRVYDGNSAAAPLLGTYSGTTLPPAITASSINGCLTFVFTSDGSGTRAGWTADVTCAPAPTCPKPTVVTVSTITSNSAQVSWTNNAPSATSFEVIWLPAGSPAPTAASTGVVTPSSPYTITGLSSQTTYDVYVRALCQPGGTDVGDWSVKATFSTTPNYCAGDHFYDLGGPTGNYPNNVTAANGTTTICPENPGDVVTVYFNSFELISSVGDSLTIYDGDSTTGTPVGTYFGTNIIPSYTATSPTGCLTFVFTSNGTQNAPGWDATILCAPPCPSITAVLNSSTPAIGSENVIRICQGQSVEFNGSGVFAADGTGATYEWNFGDGGTATGQSVSHVFTTEGIYLVNLFVTDANGCRSTNRLNQLVYVSTTPSFSGITILDDEICLGQSTTITGAATPTSFVRDCAPPVSGTTFLPDGSGVSYQTSIPVDCFPFGTTLTSASQITSVCINMEHSYLGDLTISLVSPSGQTIILQPQGGGSANLGIPIASNTVDGGGAPGPGTGYNYCFTMSAATTLTGGIVNGVTFPSSNGGTYTDSSVPAGNYLPNQPFGNLIGSTLNGNWSIIVTDNIGIDNGYLFNWGINFDTSLLPADYQFTPTIASSNWSADSTITATNGEQITVTPTATGTQCYTYNVTDNFGCTYSQQVCLQVNPGVELNSIQAAPAICQGDNGIFTFTGTPDTTVTFNIDGGANQTVLLDANGTAQVTLVGLVNTSTINATYITAPAIPTTGNAIAAVGGSNPNNAVGAILAAGTTASTANSLLINAANPTTTLTLANDVPTGTPITISIAKNNNASSVTIVDGPSTLLFNTGTLNQIQHVTFIKGTNSNTITINRNNGNTLLDGVSYSYDELGCDRPLNIIATQVVDEIPTLAVINPLICVGGNGSFQINGGPNDTIGYSLNGGAVQTVTLDAQGVANVDITNPNSSITIELLDVNGNCVLSTPVTDIINVENCEIPKGISPNGDGKNDNLDLSNFNVSNLEIFNRHGRKVYSKSNYSNEWFGQSDKGDDLPDATYYFVIEFNDSPTKTGWIYINRQY